MMGSKSKFTAGAQEHAARFVRDGIRAGRWGPGEALEATAVAGELGISPSPVREAFARLRGERLLETRHRDGYSVPLLAPHEIEGEYRFLRLVATSLATHPRQSEHVRRPRAGSYGDRVDELLMALARAADLPTAAIILHQSVIRLHSYIEAEPLVIANVEEDLAEMERLADAGRAEGLLGLIDRHFTDCIAAAPSLGRHVFERSKRSEKEFD